MPLRFVFSVSRLKPSYLFTVQPNSHWASVLGTGKFNLWVEIPKSIMIAVTRDLADSEPVMICEDHFLKLPSREFTLKVYLPFRSAVDFLLPWWLRGGGGFLFSGHSQVPLFAVYKEVALSQRLASPEALLGHV